MRQARFRYTVFLAMLAFTVMLALPSTTLGWDREAAKTYAETYTSQFFDFRNPAWPSFSGGGDCTNFTSQCFDAGGIQMDAGWTSWNMVMYAGTTWRWGEEWTVAMQFWDYWKQPLPHGNRYLVGTWDWLDGTSRPDPPKNVPGVQRGDILSYVLDFDGSTWTDINHSAIVTGINSHTQITPSMD
jgi:hypothetical protein